MAIAKLKGIVKSPENFDIQDLSQNVFKVRRILLEQLSRMERELQTNFNRNAERFATKEEMLFVFEKVHEFRTELDNTLVRVEEKLSHSSDEILKILQELSRETAKRAQKTDPSEDMEKRDFFTGLNPFNMRRRYHELSLSLRSEEVDPFGFDPVFNKFLYPILDFFYAKYWRIETYGISHVPKEGPALLVANHSGGLPYDAIMLKQALEKEHPTGRQLRFMVEDFIFHLPFVGSLMNRAGGVRASQENAEQILANSHTAIVFPEGIKGLGKLYRDKYHLARFGRGGFIRLCLRTRAPLVPVAFIGPEEIHPMIYRENVLAKFIGVPYIPVTWTFPWLGPMGMLPLPSKWSIHILPPIDFSNYGPGAENDRVLVYKLSRQVKEQIQDTIVDKLRSRRSIWFG